MNDEGLRPVLLCKLCRSGAGGECHMPGCALCNNRAPDLPISDDLVAEPENLRAAFESTVAAWKAFNARYADVLTEISETYTLNEGQTADGNHLRSLAREALTAVEDL
jgi:hypothetical protein